MPSQGLTLTSADRADGLAGAYRRGDEVVFFRARSEGVNEEWVIEMVLDPLRRRSSTPKYSVRLQVLDRNCQNIASTGGFLDGSVAPYTASADDVAAHQADLRLVEEAMFAVAGSPLAAPLGPELEQLKQAGGAYHPSGAAGPTVPGEVQGGEGPPEGPEAASAPPEDGAAGPDPPRWR